MTTEIKTNYQNLLSEKDSLRKLDVRLRTDLRDYVNMRNKRLYCIVKWEKIRSMCITKNGVTLWQLSEKHLNLDIARAVGVFESPVSLFEWLYSKAQ